MNVQRSSTGRTVLQRVSISINDLNAQLLNQVDWVHKNFFPLDNLQLMNYWRWRLVIDVERTHYYRRPLKRKMKSKNQCINGNPDFDYYRNSLIYWPIWLSGRFHYVPYFESSMSRCRRSFGTHYFTLNDGAYPSAQPVVNGISINGLLYRPAGHLTPPALLVTLGPVLVRHS